MRLFMDAFITRMGRHLTVLGLTIALAVFAAAMAPGGRSARAAPPLPDLTVPSFGLVSWGVCAPGQVVFKFQARVANVGTAPSPATFVRAFDSDGSGWGTTVAAPGLAPGSSVVLTIPIFYSPHTTNAPSHPFRAMVDPFAATVESNELNNRTGAINVGVPSHCPQAG